MTTRARLKADRSPAAALLLDEEISDDEPTKEEILEGIRLGFKEAVARQTRPLDEVIQEIRIEMDENAD